MCVIVSFNIAPIVVYPEVLSVLTRKKVKMPFIDNVSRNKQRELFLGSQQYGNNSRY